MFQRPHDREPEPHTHLDCRVNVLCIRQSHGYNLDGFPYDCLINPVGKLTRQMPQSSWVRKGLEVYFTFLIELFWSKERIMEVYLNSIEMGNGIYGAQATAKVKFGTTAAQLTRGQCALIAATLPNPIRFNSAKPSSYILKRQNQILRLMNLVPKFPSEEKAVEKKKSKNKKGK